MSVLPLWVVSPEHPRRGYYHPPIDGCRARNRPAVCNIQPSGSGYGSGCIVGIITRLMGSDGGGACRADLNGAVILQHLATSSLNRKGYIQAGVGYRRGDEIEITHRLIGQGTKGNALVGFIKGGCQVTEGAAA